VSLIINMNLEVPVIGILRGVDSDFFTRVMETSFASGLQAIEITMNTDNALNIVSSNIPQVPSGKLLGMGTIRNLDEAKKAVDAGAMFLVTPNTDSEVIEYAKANSVPIIAGALTPTETYNAWAAGADMVKVFPCRPFGPDYIKELRGPFEHIPLVGWRYRPGQYNGLFRFRSQGCGSKHNIVWQKSIERP
jgi:2-dehydro-3-deoxyphosphogluconate aldolase/(4S)-4-hydroxy-2-oxoglutarate aldolase